jgi:hypothetical protein
MVDSAPTPDVVSSNKSRPRGNHQVANSVKWCASIVRV